jgi:hypothetical protein
MSEVNLFTIASKIYTSGARDTGKGVGSRQPSNLLGRWNQASPSDIPPDGWGSSLYPQGSFGDNSDLYFPYSFAGTLNGVYKYNVNDSVEPILMSSDVSEPFTSRVDMGLISGRFAPFASPLYDPAERSVVIATNPTFTTDGPIIGKWKISNWPFTAANADWLALGLSYPSYDVGKVRWSHHWLLADGKLFVSSSEGPPYVHVLDWVTGAVLGIWDPVVTTPSQYRRFSMLGWYNNRIVGGSLASGLGAQAGEVWTWDYTNPASCLDSYHHTVWKRFQSGGYQIWYLSVPLQRNELDAIGCPATAIGWWQSISVQNGPISLFLYDMVSGHWLEVPCTSLTNQRAMKHTRGTLGPHEFVKVNGDTWFIGWGQQTIEHVAEDPNGNPNYQAGVIAMQASPAKVLYEYTATVGGTPLRMLLTMTDDSESYLSSEHPSKHRFRIRLNAGAWSDWRSGSAELMNLNVVANGKSIWPDISRDDVIQIEHELFPGGPHPWDTTTRGTPPTGAESGPVVPGNLAPPIDIQPVLVVQDVFYTGDLPDIDTLQTRRIPYRGEDTGLACLGEPAPAGGAKVGLWFDHDIINVPADLTFDAGESSRAFRIVWEAAGSTILHFQIIEWDGVPISGAELTPIFVLCSTDCDVKPEGELTAELKPTPEFVVELKPTPL